MERIASAARESAARDAGFYPTAWARDRDPRYRDETMDDCRTDANRVGIGRFESLSLYNGLSACGRLPLQMTSHGASLSSLAAGRALRIGLAACLLAMTGACSSTADQTGDAATPQARTSDAADLGPTIAPTWLPGVAPAAGGNLGDERDGAAGEADVADQGIWTLPGATATRSAAPRTMVAAVPSRGAGQPATEARPPRASASDEAASSARASPADAEAFAQRGDELLQTGDVVGARFCYERAAAGGMAAAATRVGKTYDPIFLATVGVQGLQGDPSQAAVWYRKGISAGDPEALQRLSALSQMVR